MKFKLKLFVAFVFLASKSFGQEYKVTDEVFFDIALDRQFVGKIVIGLFGDIVPKTVRNFKVLATDGINGKNYSGTPFHRVIERFIIQGGDILYGNGSGFISIYGDIFEDENFIVKHTGPGYISMANAGPNTNGCQFFITTMPTPWLDDQHVVFGKVVEGQSVVHKIEHMKTNLEDQPLQKVVIVKSGIKPTSKPYFVSDYTYGVWSWIQAGTIPLGFSFLILGFFHWVIQRLDSFKFPTE